MRRIIGIVCLVVVPGCVSAPARRTHWIIEAGITYDNKITPNEDVKVAITFKRPLTTDATSKVSTKHDD
jgi:hypothetical protein